MRALPFQLLALLLATALSACSGDTTLPGDGGIDTVGDGGEQTLPDGGRPIDACPADSLASNQAAVTVTGQVKAGGRLLGSCGGAGTGEATWLWRAPKAGTFRFAVSGASFTPAIYLLSDGCDGAELACQTGSLDYELLADQRVVVVVDSADLNMGGFSLTVSEASPDYVEYCDDGVDNDFDSLIDCEDPDCALPDGDGDGVGDACDICPGGDDRADLNEDGTPDACELTCGPGTFGANCVECPGGAANACSGHGTCDEGVEGDGTCTCQEGWSGDACELQCPGTPTCSGHGVCLEGMCACAEGFAGDACDRCKTGFFGDDCKPCPEGENGQLCGGHGTCDSVGECVCAPGFTGPTCEACAFGFFGYDCEPCPGEAGAACGDATGVRGLCDWGRTATGECTCFDGFYGEDCNSACPRGDAGAGGAVCSGRGTCDDGAGGEGQCQCDEGFAGAECGACAPGLYGEDCDYECDGGKDNPCSGHGTCNSGLEGDGSCACDTGWMGALCDECDYGYFGPDCQPCPGGGGDLACTGNGYCDDTLVGAGTCDCFGDFWGAACEKVCPGGVDNACNGNGNCSDNSTGTGECTCFDGFAGAACDACMPGYYDEYCYECPGLPGAICSGQGTCSDGWLGTGECTCQPGFTGEACDECMPGRYGPTCLPCPGGEANACGSAYQDPHGTCFEGIEGDGTCECYYGWGGQACETACPGGADNPCSGNGYCTDGLCECDVGYGGSNCATILCPGWEADLPCNGNGTCLPSGECQCWPGWHEEDCSSWIPP